jgi:hypothetical protein
MINRDPIQYGTSSAHESASRLGLSTMDRDFRAAFLSITDSLLGESSTASYVGPTRDAERWTVVLCGRDIDVIYHPERAMISSVMLHRRGMSTL